MNSLNAYLTLLQEGGSGQLVTMLLPFGLIILVFYFLIIRPQNKKQKETQKMLSALKKNDRVVTIGGIRGVITSVKGDTVVVRVDDNVKMEFSKSAISNVVSGGQTEGSSKKEAAKEKDDDSESEQS